MTKLVRTLAMTLVLMLAGTVAWSISRYSKEESTSFIPNETKTEIFTISIPQQGSKEIRVQAKIVSYHGLPVVFGKPASGDVMLEASKNVVLK